MTGENGQTVARVLDNLPPGAGYLARLARRATFGIAQSAAFGDAVRPRVPSRFEPSLNDNSFADPFSAGELDFDEAAAPLGMVRASDPSQPSEQRDVRLPQRFAAQGGQFALPSSQIPPAPLPRTSDAFRPFVPPAVTNAAPYQTPPADTVLPPSPQTTGANRADASARQRPPAYEAASVRTVAPILQTGANKQERGPVIVAPLAAQVPQTPQPPVRPLGDASVSATLPPSRPEPAVFSNRPEREPGLPLSRREASQENQSTPPAPSLRPVLSDVPTRAHRSPASPTPQQARAEQAEPAPPIIQVSIGRIDVRAATSSAKAAAPAKTAPSTSLGDGLSSYLEGRDHAPQQRRER